MDDIWGSNKKVQAQGRLGQLNKNGGGKDLPWMPKATYNIGVAQNKQ